jgi:hypothetical protein
MKQKLTFLAIMASLPFFALAHGEEVLLPFFIQWGSVLLFIIFLKMSKMKAVQKLVLGASYFLAIGLIVYFTRNVPYRQNRTFLDLLLSFGPAIVATVTFFILRARVKNRLVKAG